MSSKVTQHHDALAKMVLDKFYEYSQYRTNTKLDKGFSVDEWIGRNARMYSSVHEACELAIYPQMTGYFPIARIKVDAAVGWARDLLGDKITMPWVYKPTPDPELSKRGQENVKRRMAAKLISELQARGVQGTPEQLLAAGGGVMPAGIERWLKSQESAIAGSVLTEETQIAEGACKLAMRYGKDWQMLSRFSVAFVPFLRDLYGQVCGVMAGPMPAKVQKRTYKGNRYDRAWVDGYTYRHIHASNAYFAPDASSASDGSGFVERTHRTVSELLQMIGMDDVADNNVRRVLEDLKTNTGSSWINSIIDKSLDRGAGIPTDFVALGQSGSIPTHSDGRGIESLIFHGVLSGRELSRAEITGFDLNELYDCEVEVCGNRTIRASVYNGPGARGYVSTGFTEGDIPWRTCISMLVSDGQARTNRILFRRVQAIHQQSGAFMGVDAARWDGAPPRIEPFGVGFLNSNTNGQSIQMAQPQPTFGALYQELLNELFLADTVTAIPRFDRDMSGPAETNTATEAGIRYQAAVRRQKAVAANLDMEVLRPQGERVYEWLLERNPKLQDTADAMADASGIVGGLTDGANKARMVEALMPLTQAADKGIVPAIVVEQAFREYAEGVGIDISRWQDPADAAEISGAIGAEATAPGGTPAVLQPGTMAPAGGGMVPPNDPVANVPTGIQLPQGATL